MSDVNFAQQRRTQRLRSKTAAANALVTRAQCSELGYANRLLMAARRRSHRSRKVSEKRTHAHTNVRHRIPDTRTESTVVNTTENEQESSPQHQPYARGSRSPSQIIHCIMSKTLTRTFPFMIFSHSSGVEVLAGRLIGTCTQMLRISRTSQFLTHNHQCMQCLLVLVLPVETVSLAQRQ